VREAAPVIQPQRIVMPKKPTPVAPHTEVRPGVWTRLRRTLFGEVKPVFED
jgi:hypothetical protein